VCSSDLAADRHRSVPLDAVDRHRRAGVRQGLYRQRAALLRLARAEQSRERRAVIVHRIGERGEVRVDVGGTRRRAGLEHVRKLDSLGVRSTYHREQGIAAEAAHCQFSSSQLPASQISPVASGGGGGPLRGPPGPPPPPPPPQPAAQRERNTTVTNGLERIAGSLLVVVRAPRAKRGAFPEESVSRNRD